MSNKIPPSDPSPSGHFPTTHWSVVLPAQAGDAVALEKLCQIYWQPILGYVVRWRKRWGNYSEAGAQDLVQDYFVKFLKKNLLEAVRLDGGESRRFRYFLQHTLNHFLLDELKRMRAEKRGGTSATVPLDETDSAAIPAPSDAVFDRQWAETLFGRAVQRLQAKYEAAGQQVRFATLKPCLFGEDHPPYVELGEQLGLSEGGVKKAVSEMRQRFQEMLREEVAATGAQPNEVEAELHYLLSVLAASRDPSKGQ